MRKSVRSHLPEFRADVNELSHDMHNGLSISTCILSYYHRSLAVYFIVEKANPSHLIS